MSLLDFSDEDEAPLLIKEALGRYVSSPQEVRREQVLDHTYPDLFQSRQRKQDSAGRKVRKVPFSSVDTDKQPAFLRWIFGTPSKWKTYDAQMPGFQDVDEVRIKFQPLAIGITYKGNTITSVRPFSQASVTGVKVSWKILTVNGQKMDNDSTNIQAAIGGTSSRDKMTEILFSSIMSNIKKVSFFTAQPIGINYKGNRITEVLSSSQAYVAGVLKDWIIIDVNNKTMLNNSTKIQESIYHASQQGNVVQMSFRIPEENEISIDNKRSKPDISERMCIREKRTGSYPRLYSSQHDQSDSFLKTMTKVKSRISKKYVIK